MFSYFFRLFSQAFPATFFIIWIMVCKKTTQQKYRSNTIWDWNSAGRYFLPLANWSPFGRKIFRIHFFQPPKEINPITSKPHTRRQGSKPLAKQGQNFRAPKHVAELRRHPDMSSWKQKDHGKIVDLAACEGREHPPVRRVYQLLGWPPWRYAYMTSQNRFSSTIFQGLC